ncbi:uncharacterized protein LOC135398283 isoform X2 [Ornithodoros turicata]|uniref:uncharacterized protein LOC135398283 isoform X2 n=1 Tax=Ornithodoros turicata TaxID=34597 RepID=UPI00313861B5
MQISFGVLLIYSIIACCRLENATGQLVSTEYSLEPQHSKILDIFCKNIFGKPKPDFWHCKFHVVLASVCAQPVRK